LAIRCALTNEADAAPVGPDVEKLLTPDVCIAAVEEAFRRRAEGTVPPPGILGMHAGESSFHVKAGYLTLDRPYFAAKLNANFPTTGHATVGRLLHLPFMDRFIRREEGQLERTFRRRVADLLAARAQLALKPRADSTGVPDSASSSAMYDRQYGASAGLPPFGQSRIFVGKSGRAFRMKYAATSMASASFNVPAFPEGHLALTNPAAFTQSGHAGLPIPVRPGRFERRREIGSLSAPWLASLTWVGHFWKCDHSRRSHRFVAA